MRPVLKWRQEEGIEREVEAAKAAGFDCTQLFYDIAPGDLVVARMCALPFYREVEKEIEFVGAKMINTYAQHRYIADIEQWYQDLRGYTPETWHNFIEIPDSCDGPFILKGETNSRKHLWKTHCYAKNREAAKSVLSNLLDDTLISQQKIYIRKFEPLVTFMEAINGMPITQEYRIFTAYGKILSGGYYWSSHVDDIKDIVSPGLLDWRENVPVDWLQSVIDTVSARATFVVIDVAKKQDGGWIVVELNDGQMSGRSENNPDELYGNLFKAIITHDIQ